MITLFGRGPLKISRTFGAETLVCTFSTHIVKNIDVIIDKVNKGRRNQNKASTQKMTGGYLEFDLVLLDPPSIFGGNDGNNHLKFFEILRRLIPLEVGEQYFEIIPANSDGATTKFNCILESDRIPIRDTSNIASGPQTISIKLQTQDLDPLINVPYYMDPGTEQAVVDKDGIGIKDKDGIELFGK